ncbi:MAG: hypothetical protein NVSMB38_10950 [Ktedonobacteraceae bacterium]
MKNRRTKGFHKRFDHLPLNVQKQAKATYKLFEVNPYYPSLHFECINHEASLWSVRIGIHYRAVGAWIDDTIWWDFIGTHEEYNHLL